MGLVLEVRDLDDPDVVRMTEEVQAEYVVRYGGPDRTALDPTEFTPPDGLFMVGVLDGRAVAMGGWRRHAPGEAEIKRMYVSASARRRGLGRLLLAELERSAVEAGIQRLVLGTGERQPEAIAMYELAGYESTTGFGYYDGQTGAMFYAKQMSGPPRT